MKKISKEEMPEVMHIRRNRMSELRSQLEQLEVGEGLFLPRQEWKTKNSPTYIVSAIRKKWGYHYEWGFLADGTGWLFKRVN